MRVLKESTDKKELIIQTWKQVIRSYADLMIACRNISEYCKDIPELSPSANVLPLEIEDIWETYLSSMEEEILDLYFPIDYDGDEDGSSEKYDASKRARAQAFDESVSTNSLNINGSTNAEYLQRAIRIAELLKTNYVGKDRKKVLADCDALITEYKTKLKELKGNKSEVFNSKALGESVYSDIVGEPLQGVEQPPILVSEVLPEGPSPDEVGVSSLILDAIANSAKTIDQYNIMKANSDTPELIPVIDDIISNENFTLGKLQSMLKVISPNAENIMNGAVSAEDIMSTGEQSSPLTPVIPGLDAEAECILAADAVDDEF